MHTFTQKLTVTKKYQIETHKT